MESVTCSSDSIKRYGLTEVHRPATKNPLVDIVFVHGLDGDPQRTWTRGGVFWPAQLLPSVLREQKARILVYGYDADIASSVYGTSNERCQSEASECTLSSIKKVLSEATTKEIASSSDPNTGERTYRHNLKEPLFVSKDRIHHHAENLVAQLWANRGTTEAAERPIIFVAHSLGGLVVKRALIYSSEIRGPKTGHLRSISVSTHGILFFGTPHQGFDVKKWIYRYERSCSAIKPYDTLESQPPILNSLTANNETLQVIDRQFMQLTSKLCIYFFYEGKPTIVDGSLGYIVEKESAAPTIHDVESASIQQDHFHMCKFENEESPGFNLVTEAIQRYADAAPRKIKANWEYEHKNARARVERQVKELGGSINRGDESASNALEKTTDSHQKRHYIVPRERVKDFVGREAELKEISAYFPKNRKGNQPQVVILHALGGQGKSQIALEYCSRQSSREQYSGIFWVNATSEALAMQSYARIATALDGASSADVGDGEQITDLVKEKLEDWNSAWLMVFDNYDQPQTFSNIRKFVPKFGQGHIIFTSRNPNLERLGHLIAIPAMSSHEGTSLLLCDYGPKDIQQHSVVASRIIDLLGGLPLAIDQARAYIRHQLLPLHRLEDFITAYDSKRKQILSHTPRDFWEYGTMQIHGKEEQNKAISAFTTWEMSLEQLRDDKARRKDEMTHFLTLSTFFNPARIEEYLYRHYWEDYIDEKEWLRLFSMDNEHSDAESDEEADQWSSEKYREVLRKFHELSLIQNARRDTEEAVFSLHPLIRDWLQLRQKAGERQTMVEESAKVVAASVGNDDLDRTTLEYRTSLLSHVDACLSNDERFSKDQHLLGNHIDSCSTASCLAQFYEDQGYYETSEKLLRRVVTTKHELLGVEHVETLEAKSLLSYALRLQGKYDEAEKLLRKSLQVAKRVLGEEHDETVKTFQFLAKTLDDQGKYEEAEKTYRQVLDWRVKILGETHGDTQLIMHNLAITLFNQGKYEEAENIQRVILSTEEETLGKKHSDTLQSMNNLAVTLESLGKYEEAKSMHYETLKLRQEVLGKKHPDTLDSMYNLADLLSSHEEEQMLRQTLASQEEILGKKHPDTLNTMNNLAVTLRKLGKNEEAKSLYYETLQLRQEVLGKKHPDTLRSMFNLADLLPSHEEEKMLRQTLVLWEEVLGREHPDTLTTMSKLAITLEELGENEEAKSLFYETLQLRQKVLGKTHPDTLNSMYNLADLLPSHEEEQMLRQTLVLQEEVLGREHQDTLRTRKRLAKVVRQQEEREEKGEARELDMTVVQQLPKIRNSRLKFMKRGALAVAKLVHTKRPPEPK